MQRYNQSIFSVETLQIEGTSQRQQLFYNIYNALRFGITFLLVIWPIMGIAGTLAEWPMNPWRKWPAVVVDHFIVPESAAGQANLFTNCRKDSLFTQVRDQKYNFP